METTTPSDPANILTTRQFNVFVLWIKELSIEQIADKLNLSYWCVDKELRIIYKLLGARTAKYAVDKAWLLGIFTIENRK
jgi:DNA-binding CsgD family transcriptional regulator